MATQIQWNGDDRRQCARLASKGPIDAVVIDQHNQPITCIEDAQIVNICGGGIAFSAATAAPPGTRVKVTVFDDDADAPISFVVQVIGTDDYINDRFKIHTNLVSGQVPARLIYKW